MSTGIFNRFFGHIFGQKRPIFRLKWRFLGQNQESTISLGEILCESRPEATLDTPKSPWLRRNLEKNSKITIFAKKSRFLPENGLLLTKNMREKSDEKSRRQR